MKRFKKVFTQNLNNYFSTKIHQYGTQIVTETKLLFLFPFFPKKQKHISPTKKIFSVSSEK